MPPDIETWCSRIETEKQGIYPIDQSDGGEDDDPAEHAQWAAKLKALGRNPAMPWQQQSSLIAIDGERDYISDRGDEVWSILEQRRIKRVILTGVHTNMCVLGRPFGLRQMAKNGKTVVLLRDLTDCMYNPRRWPQVDHFTGNDLVVSHVERYVCPTITSDQILGGGPFRSKFDARTTTDIAELPAAAPIPSLAPYQNDWKLIDLPMTWEKLTGGAVQDHQGIAWYRCAVRMGPDWLAKAGATLSVPAATGSCSAWLNGEPLKPAARGESAQFQIDPKTLPPREAHLLVLRIVHERGSRGLAAAPLLESGDRKLSLQGRWQLRSATIPLGPICRCQPSLASRPTSCSKPSEQEQLMDDLPADLATPVFRRVFERYRTQPRVASIRRLDLPPSQLDYENEIVPQGYPLVFRDPDVQTPSWSEAVERLVQAAGDTVIQVRQAQFTTPADYALNRRLQEVTLAQYIARIDTIPNPDAKYAGNQPLPAHLARLWQAGPPRFVPAGELELPAFWLGPTAATTPLHKDSTDNFAYHIAGTKRWYLFAVQDASRLEYGRVPGHDPRIEFAVSRLSATSPTQPEFAEKTGAMPVVVDVSAGEVLYLPAGWGHHVVNLTPALMINYWQSRDSFAKRWGVARDQG